MTKHIRNRQEMVFDFIVQYKTDNGGTSPTLREIAAGIGLKSIALLQVYLMRLEMERRIEVVGTRHIAVRGEEWRLNV